MAKQRHHANQLAFNFEDTAIPMAPMTAECAAIVHAHLPPAVLPPVIPHRPTFDFKTSFPEPRRDAVDAGVFGTDAPDAAAVRSIHQEHGKELLCILADLDAIAESRIDGIDPRTGKAPRGVAAREKLEQFFRTEPGRLEARFESLMEVYANAFGEDAAVQFEAVLRSQHESQDIEAEFEERYPMPVPEPLPEAVEKGNFGMEDEHTPVDPSPDEVFALTEHHGERMVELLERLETIEDQLEDATGEQRRLTIAEKDCTLSAYQGLVALYAEDFGELATRRLVAWAKARIGMPTLMRAADSAVTESTAAEANSSPQYDPGHPWYYLARGDGQPPIPVEQIPSSECDGSFVGKLPKDAAKRRKKLERMLADETAHLAGFELNYRDLIERGVQALGRYDRTIAYGGDDELAVASSLALRFNHIAHGRGRVRWLKNKLGLSADCVLSDMPSEISRQAASPEPSTEPRPVPSELSVTRPQLVPTAEQSERPGETSTSSPIVGSGPLRGTTNGGRMQTEIETPKSLPSTRVEKLEKLHETIEQALDQLSEALEAGKSETLKAWLTTMSRFHNYSLGNQMLIAWQKPDATHVAGFHAWKKFNRLVSKGEKGIMILAPITKVVATVKEQDKSGNLKEKPIRKLVNTKVVYVFDVTQTHGDPLPELAAIRGDPESYTSKLKDLIKDKGIELYFAERLSLGAQGLSEGGRIGIQLGLSPAEEFRTLAHELAHELLHRGDRRKETTKRSRELEAESVAFVVCTTIGLDAKETSTDYIHLYRGDKAALFESMQFIRQVSQDILSALLPLRETADELHS